MIIMKTQTLTLQIKKSSFAAKRKILPVFEKFPFFIRKFIWNRILGKHYKKSYKDLEIKIAETPQEITAALNLIYNNYKKTGFIHANAYEKYISKYSFLPSTILIIGKVNKQVICTISVIRDNPIGFPTEKAWNISSVKKRYNNIVELSTLTVRKDYQGSFGKILLPLFTYVYRFCRNTIGVDAVIMSSIKEASVLYKDLLGFKSLDGDPIATFTRKRLPSRFLYLSVTESEKIISKRYKKNNKKNLYHFIFNKKFKNFKYPTYNHWRDFNNYRLTTYYKNHGLKLIKEIDIDECNKLNSYYEFSSIIPITSANDYEVKRQSKRYQTSIPCVLRTFNRKRKKALITDVSVDGLKLKGVRRKSNPRIYVTDGKGKYVHIDLKYRWINEKTGEIGCIVAPKSKALWQRLLNQTLEIDFNELLAS